MPFRNLGSGLTSLLIGDKLMPYIRRRLLPTKTTPKLKKYRSKKASATGRRKPISSKAYQGVNTFDQGGVFNFAPIVRGMNPIPMILYNKVTYADYCTIASTTGGLAGTAAAISLNGIYAPCVTSWGLNRQPRGYDQMQALYSRWKVEKVDVRLMFGYPSAADKRVFGCWQVLNPSNYTSTPAGFYVQDFEELNSCGCVPVRENDEESVKAFTIDIAKVSGHKTKYDPGFDDNYTGSASGNPGNPVYLKIASANNSASDAISCIVRVCLTYHVKWYNPINVNAS